MSPTMCKEPLFTWTVGCFSIPVSLAQARRLSRFSHFPEEPDSMSNEVRRTRMRKAMEAQKLDALILRLPENVLLLSGHWPMIGVAFLVFPLEGKATGIFPECFCE